MTNCVKIPLTKGYEATIDKSDAEAVLKHKWQAKVDVNTVYARRAKTMGDGSRKYVYLHREILGAGPMDQIDHADGDGLNNLRSNIRFCSASQNQWNKSKQKNNTSGYKGVTWCRSKSKWKAQISFGGKRKSLGWFDCPIEAHKRYREQAKIYHGNYAKA